jgi:HD-GYP domain-containing protein (c-di-GMP phosphodiesterase class II)
VASVETSAAAPILADEVGTELVARRRNRSALWLKRREEALALALGGAFAAAAIAAALFLPVYRPFSLLTAAIAVAAYAVVSRVAFEVNNGTVVPTQLVLVPMLFTLPTRTVPLAIAAGLLLGQAPRFATGKLSLSHLPLVVANATHSLGPAVVLALAGATTPSWHHVPIYLAALAAQFGADFVPGAIYSRRAWGVPVAQHARSMRVAFFVDACLAPVGLAVAIAAHDSPWAVVIILPLVALLKVFARERQVRIDHAVELSTAYRGTAILLGDVIEADDQYTGAHSRDVVELVLAVSDRLGLEPSERRRAEFAALLHDVGKVKIPSELINKPGPLEPAERALMNTHTIIGQNMLDQVGGMLGEVGHIVRSCHERWDGAGYPDGIAGAGIPLAARIVCACDAWSAMTSDRSYRKALPRELAAAELCACAGTQFDPRVVAALVSVLGL